MLLPLSSREIIAERDLMRAECAIDRRKFEQEAESLRTMRAADMAEIGRRAAQFATMDEKYTALEARHVEQSAELIAARHTEADALAQHAVALSLLHSDGGLVERKEADLTQLRVELAQCGRKLQPKVRLWPILRRNWRYKGRGVGGVSGIETSRAAERRLVEKIARISAQEAAARKDFDAERARGENLAQELAALRRLNAGRDNTGRDAAPRELGHLTTERDENAVLRQTINEIGAAIIRTAALSLEPAATPQERFESGEPEARAAAGANVKATSK